MNAQDQSFMKALAGRWQRGNFISVGLDGDPGRLPPECAATGGMEDVLRFHELLIESTRDLAAAYKPQIAGYEALGAGGFDALIETVAMVRDLAPEVPVILDAKRADIGSTNDKYVTAAFDVIGADAITVHPYLGPEAMKPFLERADKGVIVLCRTSNPGAGRYQDLQVDGRPLYQHIARDVAETWNANGNCGLVVGATYPDEMREIRAVTGDLPFLIPGVGAQGGDVEATVKAGADSSGYGMVIHASRSLMYAYESNEEASAGEATEEAMRALHDQIHSARG